MAAVLGWAVAAAAAAAGTRKRWIEKEIAAAVAAAGRWRSA
jgi:hypothetical protein